MCTAVKNNHTNPNGIHNTIRNQNQFQFRESNRNTKQCHESYNKFDISTCILKIINMISSIKLSNKYQRSWILRTILILYSLIPITSQECACSPSVFTFRLDFNATCPPENVVTGPGTGIDAIFCQVAVEPLQGYSTASREDLTPVTGKLLFLMHFTIFWYLYLNI